MSGYLLNSVRAGNRISALKDDPAGLKPESRQIKANLKKRIG